MGIFFLLFLLSTASRYHLREWASTQEQPDAAQPTSGEEIFNLLHSLKRASRVEVLTSFVANVCEITISLIFRLLSVC